MHKPRIPCPLVDRVFDERPEIAVFQPTIAKLVLEWNPRLSKYRLNRCRTVFWRRNELSTPVKITSNRRSHAFNVECVALSA